MDVTWKGQTVGTVECVREGLYVRIFCKCTLPDREIRRLYAGNEKIGVLIPYKDCWTLETKIPAKRIKVGSTFTLDEPGRNFYPIRPGAEFDHLDKLRSGRLIICGEQIGLAPAEQ